MIEVYTHNSLPTRYVARDTSDDRWYLLGGTVQTMWRDRHPIGAQHPAAVWPASIFANGPTARASDLPAIRQWPIGA